MYIECAFHASFAAKAGMREGVKAYSPNRNRGFVEFIFLFMNLIYIIFNLTPDYSIKVVNYNFIGDGIGINPGCLRVLK